MGSSIEFFAAPTDDRSLCEVARTLGLRLVTPWLDQLGTADTEEPSRGAFWYLSFLPVGDLHPYGDPPVQVSDATDPLIEFLRSYYVPPFLVAGRLYWADDVPALSRRTKPYFLKLARWIKSNWARRADDGYYVGPEAMRLIVEDLAQTTYVAPGVEVEHR